MAYGRPQEVDTVIVGNGPSALILSYILHGHIPWYDSTTPHPDHLLHDKLASRSDHDLLNVDIDALTDHFTASRFSYSTQALPINVLLDTLIRPLGETEDAQKTTCVKWVHDPSRTVPHLIFGNNAFAGGQWEDGPVDASWDIGTLSYAGMISLPGYAFDQHYVRRNACPMPTYLRPSRSAVADYLASYPDQVGISDSFRNGEVVSQITRLGEMFHIGSHKIVCKHLILASGVFSEMIAPPPILQSLAQFSATKVSPDQDSSYPILVIGSGFSAADVIISSHACQKIIHVFKWAPSTSPSPLRACHQQAYPEYAGVYRRMKVAALSHFPRSDKRPKPRHTHSEFDQCRDWASTYEGIPNAQIIQVEPSADGRSAMVSFQIGSEPSFQRQVSSLAYVVGRRGTLKYLSPSLLREVLPCAKASTSSGLDVSKTTTVSAHSLREKANEDLEMAPSIFITGSLTGDSLIRFAFGGCTYAAGKIMSRHVHARERHQLTSMACPSNGSPIVSPVNGIPPCLKERATSRPQTPSPRIPAMSGLDGHESSPLSLLADKCNPLDRRKEKFDFM
ncbi:hypothetical protein LTR84_006465 [Exophiala bonariae]|uniref:L-ornithine N(5)-oxygenase n=1 Tax=Exophiala bonariae TaxID=1690606 RepID=A0AAV9N4G9_9EURO|nr:hypothetical protein LTR84_006465 [Exophiala bonariae]